MNGSTDHDYNYTVLIYTQNGSISRLRYKNTFMEIILQYEIIYFMNITSECCGNTVTVDNFNFQFRIPTPHPIESYNISVKLYFDFNPNVLNYNYTQAEEVHVTSTSRLSP